MDIAVVGRGRERHARRERRLHGGAGRARRGRADGAPRPEAAQALIGSALDDEALARAAAAASAAARPIDDKRGTVEYRRQIAGVLTRVRRLIALPARDKAKDTDVSRIHVTTTINGEPMEFLCEPARDAARRAARPARPDRHEGRLRDRRLRRLLGPARRPARAVVPGARGRGRRARRSRRSKASRRAARCIRCSSSSSSTPRCSAASARRASSSRPRRCSTRTRIRPRTEARYWLAGNLCRCTGYDKIIRAVLDAADGDAKGDRMSERQQFHVRRHAADPSRRRRQGHRPRATSAPTSRCRACCTARCCAARTRTRASCRSTRRRPQAHRRASRRSSPAPTSRRRTTKVYCGGEGALDLARHGRQRDGARQGALPRSRGRGRRRDHRSTSPRGARGWIEVEYEVLEPVMTLDRALAADAPILHRRAAHDGGEPRRARRGPDQRRGAHGTASAATSRRASPRPTSSSSASSARRWSTRATSSRTRASRATVRTAASWSGAARRAISGARCVRRHARHLDAAKIRVIPSEIGGGFGGKIPVYLEPLAVVLSQQGRPAGEDGDGRATRCSARPGPTSGCHSAR